MPVTRVAIVKTRNRRAGFLRCSPEDFPSWIIIAGGRRVARRLIDASRTSNVTRLVPVAGLVPSRARPGSGAAPDRQIRRRALASSSPPCSPPCSHEAGLELTPSRRRWRIEVRRVKTAQAGGDASFFNSLPASRCFRTGATIEDVAVLAMAASLSPSSPRLCGVHRVLDAGLALFFSPSSSFSTWRPSACPLPLRLADQLPSLCASTATGNFSSGAFGPSGVRSPRPHRHALRRVELQHARIRRLEFLSSFSDAGTSRTRPPAAAIVAFMVSWLVGDLGHVLATHAAVTHHRPAAGREHIDDDQGRIARTDKGPPRAASYHPPLPEAMVTYRRSQRISTPPRCPMPSWGPSDARWRGVAGMSIVAWSMK